VLVVDDQPDVRFMMENMLRRMGHKPEVCADAGSALEILRENPDHFNLLVTDQTMPGMTGCELADRVADGKINLPVILMSGFSVENLASLVQNRPVIVATLRKPIDRNELTRAINKAVLQKHAA
jgi:DNA-binding NtrC family response regulator